MKKALLLLPFILLSCSSSLKATDLYIFSEDGKYGYFNDERAVIIKPSYIDATNFNNGYATVELESALKGKYKYAVIDQLGNTIFEFLSEDSDIPIVSNKRIRFKRDGKYGFYNLFGEELIYGYDRANNFSEGFSVVKDQSIAPKRFLIDIDGNPLVGDDGIVNFFSIQDFHEGLAKVTLYNAEDDKILNGFINKSSNIQIPITYSFLDSRFYEGYCIASVNDEIQGSEDIKAYGIINKDNQWVIPPNYYEIRPFNGKYFAVRYEKSEPKKAIRSYWKLIDLQGNDHIVFDDSIIIRGGVENGKYTYTNEANFANDYIGFINQEGLIITDLDIKRLTFFDTKYCPVIVKNENAILSEDGTITNNSDFLKFE